MTKNDYQYYSQNFNAILKAILTKVIYLFPILLFVNVSLGNASQPDLIVTSVDGPSSGAAGDTVSISFSVQNRGSETTDYSQGGVFDIGVYLSTDTTITASDASVCNTIENEITAGQTKNYTLSCQIPANLTDGSYYWGVIADPGGFVVEASESNNSHYDSITIEIKLPYLNVPYYYQGGYPWCSFASTSMLASYLGVDIKPRDVAQYFKKSPFDGFTLSEIYSQQFYDYIYYQIGYDSEIIRWDRSYLLLGNPVLLDKYIIDSINANNPLMLAITDEKHAIVVIGTYNEGIYVHDPSGYIVDEIKGTSTDRISCKLTWDEFHSLFTILENFLAPEVISVRLIGEPQEKILPISVQIMPGIPNLENDLDWIGFSSFKFHRNDKIVNMTTWDGQTRYGFFTNSILDKIQDDDEVFGSISTSIDTFDLEVIVQNASSIDLEFSILTKIIEVDSNGSTIQYIKDYESDNLNVSSKGKENLKLFGPENNSDALFENGTPLADIIGFDNDPQTIQYIKIETNVIHQENSIATSSYIIPINNPASQPDLIVTSVDGPSSGAAGDTVSVSFSVKNNGTETTDYYQGGIFDIGVYLSTNTDINTSDTPVCNTIEYEIVAGDTKSYTMSCQIPSGLADGSYYWGVIADPGGFVVEGIETNNTGNDATPLVMSSAVPGQPDLIVTTWMARAVVQPVTQYRYPSA